MNKIRSEVNKRQAKSSFENLLKARYQQFKNKYSVNIFLYDSCNVCGLSSELTVSPYPVCLLFQFLEFLEFLEIRLQVSEQTEQRRESRMLSCLCVCVVRHCSVGSRAATDIGLIHHPGPKWS